ncbi:MAG: hypothetical protein JNK26_00630 [Candidatus Doudnabacteria bacterium]|nr:hypothetical protein [Candidatus Doudnabacteria bacterium]
MLKSNHLGEYGFKIDTLLAETTSDLVLGNYPFSLSEVAATYTSPQTQSLETESNWEQIIGRMINAWRWWADSYGYFHRKNDSVAFGHELGLMLESGILQFDKPYWQYLGLRQSYNLREEPIAGHIYIDPDTNNILPTRDKYTHPLLIGTPEPFTVNVNLAKLHPSLHSEIGHVARIAMLATDIAITISAYSDEKTAQKMIAERPVHFQFTPDANPEQILEFLHWAMRTSSESIQFLGKTNVKSTLVTEWGSRIGNKTSQLAASLNIIRTNGIRNSISWHPELNLPQSAGDVKSALQVEATDQGVPLRGTPESAQDAPKKEPRTAAKPPKTKSGTSWQLNSITKPFQTQSGLQVYLTFIPATFQVLVASDEPSRLAELDSPSFQMFMQTLRIILQYNLPVAELQQLANIGDNPETIELQNIICQQIHAFQPAQPGE